MDAEKLDTLHPLGCHDERSRDQHINGVVFQLSLIKYLRETFSE